jgi:hypothetical protein
MRKLLTVKEATQFIIEFTGKAISERQVSRYIQNGDIQSDKYGNKYLVTIAALKKYKRRCVGKWKRKKD